MDAYTGQAIARPNTMLEHVWLCIRLRQCPAARCSAAPVKSLSDVPMTSFTLKKKGLPLLNYRINNEKRCFDATANAFGLVE